MNATPTSTSTSTSIITGIMHLEPRALDDGACRVRWLRRIAARRMASQHADYDALRASHSTAMSRFLVNLQTWRMITRAMHRFGLSRSGIALTCGEWSRCETRAGERWAATVHATDAYQTWAWIERALDWTAPSWAPRSISAPRQRRP